MVIGAVGVVVGSGGGQDKRYTLGLCNQFQLKLQYQFHFKFSIGINDAFFIRFDLIVASLLFICNLFLQRADNIYNNDKKTLITVISFLGEPLTGCGWAKRIKVLRLKWH